MSRVEDQQKKQVDSERLQKQQDRTARDSQKSDQARQRFGELVKQGTQQRQLQEGASQKSGLEKQGEQIQGQLQQQGQHTAREARLARGGVLQHTRIMEQAKSFEGTLKNQRQETQETHKGRVEQRDEGLGQAREAMSERASDLEKHKETRVEGEKETLREEAREEGRVNASIDGSARKGGKGGGGAETGSGGQGQPQGGSAGVQAAGSAEAAHEVKQIPEEILKALAQEIYVGVNERGLTEFRVELKDGVLQGATMRIEAQDGKIRLRFEGLEGHAKNLVAASEGELARRLQGRGLHLDALVV